MKHSLTIVLILAILATPGAVLAQQGETPPPTPEQIQAVQNQAGQSAGNASAYSGQASNLRSQAAQADAAANAAAQQAAALNAQAQQMRVDATNAALNAANQAKAKSDEAAQKYAEAEALLAQANVLESKARLEWQRAKALFLQAVGMALQYAQTMQAQAMTATQHQVNEAMLSGVVHEQRNTVAALSNQIAEKDRLILGVSLLAVTAIAISVWLFVQHSRRTVDQLTVAFAQAMRRNETAVVNDTQVRSYTILDRVANESGYHSN